MAKIPFSINYKPQIESGEYKVVTGDDRPVRIISWDKKLCGDRYEIVALVTTQQGDTETVQLYSTEGILIASSYNEKFKLFIITPETELTEFEKALESFYNHHLQVCTYDNQGTVEDSLHDGASKLLSIAKKELCNRCSTGLNEYWRGRKEAAEEASRGFHYEGPYMPTYNPCHYGGECTNPFRDCFNCHRGATTVGINTTTGTSTAKMER